MKNKNIRIFEELANKLGISVQVVLKHIAEISTEFGELKNDILILELSGGSIEERLDEKQFVPVQTAVISIADLSVEQASNLRPLIGTSVWGLPLLHLHTEYVAKALISSILNGGESGKVFIPSATITLAAALEAAIGEATVIKTRELLGQDNYKKIASAIGNLGPMQRIETLIPFASKGEFILRTSGNKNVQLIRELVPLRNKLMHQNMEFLQFKVVESQNSTIGRLEFPKEFVDHLDRITLNNSKLEDYWTAYQGLKSSFLRVDEYKEDDFLQKSNGSPDNI
jgi:hypothetical protein